TLIILFLQCAFINSGNAQIPLTEGPGVAANFGVDGDVHANILRFGYFHYNVAPYGSWTDSSGISNQVGTDDWFKSASYPGPGIGVIDTTGAAAFKAYMAGAGGAVARNRSFKRGMA